MTTIINETSVKLFTGYWQQLYCVIGFINFKMINRTGLKEKCSCHLNFTAPDNCDTVLHQTSIIVSAKAGVFTFIYSGYRFWKMLV